MPIQLHSRQEAAFNAAGEAMSELGFEISLNYQPGREAFSKKFSANAVIRRKHNRFSSEYVFGHGNTPAEAVRDLLPKYEEKLNEEAKLETAKEAIAAVRDIVNEAKHSESSIDELDERIAALPVKG